MRNLGPIEVKHCAQSHAAGGAWVTSPDRLPRHDALSSCISVPSRAILSSGETKAVFKGCST